MTAPTATLPELTPPAFVECAVGALVAERGLRDAILGDLAEEFAERCEEHGPARARRWYRAQATRSAPHLVAAFWWPAPPARVRRLRALLAGVAGGYLTVLVLHQVAQLLAGMALTSTGHGGATWAFAACSLGAGAACGVLGGDVAARALPEAPLGAALSLGLVCALLGVTGIVVNGGAMPLWYWGGLQLLLLPLGACLGGLLRARRQTSFTKE